jgi:hypothetical protein
MEVAMHAICRFAANAALRVRDVGLLRIAFAIALLSTLPATSARAEITQDQAVNFAVEAGVRALALTGVSIPPEAVHLLKDMVGCGAKGGSVGDCAKQAAVNVALQTRLRK